MMAYPPICFLRGDEEQQEEEVDVNDEIGNKRVNASHVPPSVELQTVG